MALKRESSKKLSSIYYQNISEKIKRKLNEGKFELKPSFVKKKQQKRIRPDSAEYSCFNLQNLLIFKSSILSFFNFSFCFALSVKIVLAVKSKFF